MKKPAQCRTDGTSPPGDGRGLGLSDHQYERSFCPELVPIFMMIETELFHAVNAKAARRNVGYDALIRTILREHLEGYE